MATQEFPMGLLEKYLGSLADILGINEVLISYILGALFLLALFVLIRVFSGRRSINIKLTTPKLPEEASLVPQETLDGLTALYNSTKGALQILKTFQARKKIGSELFEKLSSGYRAQLSKIENKFLEEIKSAEHDRLQKVYDKSLKPTTTAADTTSTSFPYIDLIPSVGETLTSTSGCSSAPPPVVLPAPLLSLLQVVLPPPLPVVLPPLLLMVFLSLLHLLLLPHLPVVPVALPKVLPKALLPQLLLVSERKNKPENSPMKELR